MPLAQHAWIKFKLNVSEREHLQVQVASSSGSESHALAATGSASLSHAGGGEANRRHRASDAGVTRRSRVTLTSGNESEPGAMLGAA